MSPLNPTKRRPRRMARYGVLLGLGASLAAGCSSGTGRSAGRATPPDQNLAASSRAAPNTPVRATGRLRDPIEMRPVTAEKPAGPKGCAAAWPASADHHTCYRLGKGMTVRAVGDLSVAAPGQQGQSGWTVQLTLRPADGRAFAALSAKAYANYWKDPSAPQSKIAIVVGGDKVLSAPAVAGTIDGGHLVISGSPHIFTRAYVEGVVRRISGT